MIFLWFKLILGHRWQKVIQNHKLYFHTRGILLATHHHLCVCTLRNLSTFGPTVFYIM